MPRVTVTPVGKLSQRVTSKFGTRVLTKKEVEAQAAKVPNLRLELKGPWLGTKLAHITVIGRYDSASGKADHVTVKVDQAELRLEIGPHLEHDPQEPFLPMVRVYSILKGRDNLKVVEGHCPGEDPIMFWEREFLKVMGFAEENVATGMRQDDPIIHLEPFYADQLKIGVKNPVNVRSDHVRLLQAELALHSTQDEVQAEHSLDANNGRVVVPSTSR